MAVSIQPVPRGQYGEPVRRFLDILRTRITDLSVSGGLDHTLLANIGTNTHAVIDAHIADGTKHFTMLDEDDMISDSATQAATQQSIKAYVDANAISDHTLLSNIGTNTHAAIDTHIADTTIHYTMLDEDNMASDSATQAATQQSIKAYVTSSVSAVAHWSRSGTTLTPTTSTDQVEWDEFRYQTAQTGATGCMFVGETGNTANTGANNFYMGESSGAANTTGDSNFGLGRLSLTTNTTGSDNVATGANSLFSNVSGSQNCAYGTFSLRFNTASFNSAFGQNSMENNSSGAGNAAFGQDTLNGNTTGDRNTGFGRQSLYNNQDGDDNTAAGVNALVANVSGNENCAFGMDSLSSNTASLNCAFGVDSLKVNTSGTVNNAFGYQALLANTTSNHNNAFGRLALRANTTGTFNSAFGNSSLFDIVTGSNNSAFGYQSGANALGSNNLFLGFKAGFSETGSNRLYIETSNSTTPLIYGEFDNDVITINGSHEVTKAIRTSAVETITASSDTLDDTNYFARCDCSSNNITINLPTAAGNTGLTYIIKKIDATGNTVVIDGSGSETIDGSTTVTITSQYTSQTIISNGTNWDIV